jgi:DNA-directed RNA polymerases I, II, and III subunit RPABC1
MSKDVVHQVLNEMMRDRGCDTLVHEDDVTLTFANAAGELTLIYLIPEPKVSVKKIKQIKEFIEESSRCYRCLLLVYKQLITTFAKQYIISDVKLYVQLFSEKELMFNITKHTYVPKHTVLSLEEKRQVLRQYRTAASHFPLLLHTDPVCRYYGCVPGQMVRIDRSSETCGEYTVYRIVV